MRPINGENGYLHLLEQIMEEGERKTNRTGIDTLGIFGAMLKFDLSEGFPLFTTKKIFWTGVVEELLWFIRGETNIKSLQEKGVHIWDAWAKPDGDVGPVYGKQWVNWQASDRSINQLTEVIERIKTNPNDRRLIVSAWNPAEIEEMGLPPCHLLFQFNVTNGKLNCAMYQRSCDMFLGVPFNVASYALLTHMVARVTGLGVGTFTHFLADAHVYLNHLNQVKEQCSREVFEPPTLRINRKVESIDDFKFEDLEVHNYNHHPAIKGEVAV